VDADWLETQRAILTEAADLNSKLPLYVTVALSADAARNTDQVALLMEGAEKWATAGYYLVFEHPNGDYLVEDPNWLANALDVAAGFRLKPVKLLSATVITKCCSSAAPRLTPSAPAHG